MLTLFVSYCLLLARIIAKSDWQFSYENQGYDFHKAIPPEGWKGVNRCGQPNNQSPINFFEYLGPYGMPYGAVIPAEVEKLEVCY